jgi:hypothetical protein
MDSDWILEKEKEEVVGSYMYAKNVSTDWGATAELQNNTVRFLNTLVKISAHIMFVHLLFGPH